MLIDDRILKEYPELSDSQQEAIAHTEGPQLIIAGPGSGKTHVLVIRALNILLRGLAKPSEILLCTFTEKAAFELRDRISLAAKKLNYEGNLSDLLVGTIHGISNDFLLRYRHRTPLGNNYEVLDDLTQLLFIFEHFGDIIGPAGNFAPINDTAKWILTGAMLLGTILAPASKLVRTLAEPARGLAAVIKANSEKQPAAA